jgi:hypothetical protein
MNEYVAVFSSGRGDADEIPLQKKNISRIEQTRRKSIPSEPWKYRFECSNPAMEPVQREENPWVILTSDNVPDR